MAEEFIALESGTRSAKPPQRRNMAPTSDEKTEATSKVAEPVVVSQGWYLVDSEDPYRVQRVIYDHLVSESERLYEKYYRTKSREDLQAAIDVLWGLFQASPDPLTARGPLLNLNGLLTEKFSKTNDLVDLDGAIRTIRMVLDRTPRNSQARGWYLTRLCCDLKRRYYCTSLLDDLNAAITTSREAIHLTSIIGDRTSWEYVNALIAYSDCILHRFQQTSNLDDLREAIPIMQQAIKVGDSKDFGRPTILAATAKLFNLRFKWAADTEDGRQAVLTARQAVQEMDDIGDSYTGDPVYCLQTLIDALISSYHFTQNHENLYEAITLQRRLIKRTPQDNPNLGEMLSKLGDYLNSRYRLTGDPEDLRDAIRAGEQAIQQDPQNHRSLKTLSMGILYRHERTGNLDDLNEAIRLARQAFGNAPEDVIGGDGTRTVLTHHLSFRYERTRDLSDLQEVIGIAQQELNRLPPRHLERSACLNELSVHLGFRYEHTGDLKDLEESISSAKEALDILPANQLGVPFILGNLSLSLCSRYKRMGDRAVDDLQEAVRTAKGAVDATLEGNMDLAGRLSHYANTLLLRHERTGDLEDLQEAIRVGRQAIQATPEEYPDRGIYLSKMGEYLNSLYRRSGDQGDFDQSLDYFKSALSLASATPLVRVRAGRTAAQMLASHSHWDEGAKVVQQSLGLLPLVSPRSLQRESHEHNLKELSGLPTLAASITLQAGHSASDALQLLELGRGVFSGLVLSLRGDLSRLSEEHPDLCSKYKRLREEVNMVVSQAENEDQDTILKRRWDTVHELEAIENEIRQLPGFDRFQLTPSPEELMQLASSGPIIVFNATEFRSDAIIVKESGINAIPLPLLSYADLEQNIEAIWGGEHPLSSLDLTTLDESNMEMAKILEWLWDVAVEPVLCDLGIMHSPSRNKLPQVWWIGCGVMSRLPFHAAGYHTKRSDRNAISQVVSSYIPTVRALAHMRQKTLGRLDPSGKDILVASMPETPGQSDLNTEEDLEAINESFPNASILESPSKTDVIESLKEYKVVHFACHGEFLPEKPTESSLLLMGPDDTVERLSVGEITGIDHEIGSIAYLAACSTAENSAKALMDETFNVVNSFQLAGFPHVIGSFWEAFDDTASELSAEFYRLLKDRSEVGAIGHADVAEIFHEGCAMIRNDDPEDVLRWAPFIHVGV